MYACNLQIQIKVGIGRIRNQFLCEIIKGKILPLSENTESPRSLQHPSNTSSPTRLSLSVTRKNPQNSKGQVLDTCSNAVPTQPSTEQCSQVGVQDSVLLKATNSTCEARKPRLSLSKNKKKHSATVVYSTTTTTKTATQPEKDNTKQTTSNQQPARVVHDSAVTTAKAHSCTICGKLFKFQSSLNKHNRKQHPTSIKPSICCREDSCQFTCRTLSDLRQHLQAIHSLVMDMERKVFKSEEGNPIVCAH